VLDAAPRGLAVALVEKRDFASGTSSRSSKLIHGGLRYLEQFHLMLELTRESGLKSRLTGDLPQIEAEAAYAARYEMAATVEDLVASGQAIAALAITEPQKNLLTRRPAVL
jgi:glycerol-3-phosphate dehydrogenase